MRDVIDKMQAKNIEGIDEAASGAASTRLIKSATDFIKKQAKELDGLAGGMQSRAKKAKSWTVANGLYHAASRIEDHLRRAVDEAEKAIESIPEEGASDSVFRDWAMRMKDGYYR